MILSLKLLKYYFVEKATTPTATTATTNTMPQASVEPRTGIILFTILDAVVNGSKNSLSTVNRNAIMNSILYGGKV